MRCEDMDFSSYVDNEISYIRKRKIENHLKECEKCRKILNEYRAIKNIFKELPVIETSENIVENVLISFEKMPFQEKKIFFRKRLPQILFPLAAVLIIGIVIANFLLLELKRGSISVVKKEIKTQIYKEKKIGKKIIKKRRFYGMKKKQKIYSQQAEIKIEKPVKKEKEEEIIAKKEEENIEPLSTLPLPVEEKVIERNYVIISPPSSEIKIPEAETFEEEIPKQAKEVEKTSVVWDTMEKKSKAFTSGMPPSTQIIFQKRGVPHFNGSISFSNQILRYGGRRATHQNISYAISFLKEIDKIKNIILQGNFNQMVNNTTTAKNKQTTSSVSFLSEKIKLQLTHNLNSTSTDSNVKDKSENFGINTNLTSFRFLPLNINYQKTKTKTEKLNDVTNNILNENLSLATFLKIKNIQTNISKNTGKSKNLLEKNTSKTDGININISLPLSENTSSSLGIQRNENIIKNLRNPDQNSETEVLNTNFGLTSSFKNIKFGLNISQSENKLKNVLSSYSTRTFSQTYNINYPFTQLVVFSTSYNIVTTEANRSNVANFNLSYNPGQKNKLLTGSGLSYQISNSHTKTGIENSRENFNFNSSFKLKKNVSVQTNISKSSSKFLSNQVSNSSETSTFSNTISHSKNVSDNFKYTLSFLHNLTRTKSNSRTTKTDNLNFTLSKEYNLKYKNSIIPLKINETVSHTSSSDKNPNTNYFSIQFGLQHTLNSSSNIGYSLSYSEGKTGNVRNNTFQQNLNFSLRGEKKPYSLSASLIFLTTTTSPENIGSNISLSFPFTNRFLFDTSFSINKARKTPSTSNLILRTTYNF